MELLVESREDITEEAVTCRVLPHLWILDESGNHLWQFPDDDAINDLLNTVRFKVGKIADRIGNLMS